MKLFMINIGGHIKECTIEVHDTLFIVSESFEETFDEIKRRWYGSLDSLHIDSYKVIEHVDDYKVVLGAKNDKRLYMVNYGGINPNVMEEVHKNVFIVTAEDPNEVAKELLSKYEFMNHVDTVTDVEEHCGVRIGFLKGEYTYDGLADWQGYIKLKEN